MVTDNKEIQSTKDQESTETLPQNILSIPTHRLTPGMRQYQDAKRQYPDCIILLRMGDFYELFYEDAITASKELEITLTARGQGEKRAPLAGVPYHALDNYIAKLIKKGYKCAIVEQLEDPKKAKGLVKRGVVRIITPGTIIESSLLDDKDNNYLLALTTKNNEFALAVADLSTGEFYTSSFHGQDNLLNELIRLQPKECLLPESLLVNKVIITEIKKYCCINTLPDEKYKAEFTQQHLLDHFNVPNLYSFGLQEKPLNIASAGALLYYLHETQKTNLTHLKKPTIKNNQQIMLLDAATFRNLELIKNLQDNTSKNTLLSILDKTRTSMGARLLKRWIKAPLLQIQPIQQRLQAVMELTTNIILHQQLSPLLQNIHDLERLISRINYGNANPRDLLALKTSLKQVPLIKQLLLPSSSILLKSINQLPDTSISQLIEQTIKDDSPITIREGGFIKPDYNDQLNQLLTITTNSKQYLQQLEQQERERTKISNLKIKYNRVFGYFIEVTKKNISLVPKTYIRKQTTANAERYITEELKNEEEKILTAQEKIQQLEYDLFQEIIKTIAKRTDILQQIASQLAVLDVLCSFAQVAAENKYVCPQLTTENIIEIHNGRHPVVEQQEARFIANHLTLQAGEMIIITAPNMAGKSTILRQTALIVLMAQIGSFVPAEKAVLGITDCIFTRVGAHDNLSGGQSTFMVEMQETAAILNNATEKSLVILDEIGRGTSTFDGVAIAWSVAEHIYNHLKAKTIFATHYHIMNKLNEKFQKINNYNIAVKEQHGDIIFLHKLIPGGTDRSYGIHVAKLAGLPSLVIKRAEEIQQILEKDDQMMRKIKAKKLQEQMSLDGFQ